MIAIVVDGFLDVVLEVFWALLPLAIIFIAMQLLALRLPKEKFLNSMYGLIISFVGLVLFMQGINIGFVKTGLFIGETLGSLPNNWIIVPIGFVLGFIITFAEPAVHILNDEIENVTSGYVNKKIVLYFLSTGVAFSVTLSMIRILTGISLWYFLLPGYILVLILMKFVSPLFVAIAFDSGGVVTGPMIAAFLLAITVSCSGVIEGSNPIIDGFGMIALVSLVPILAILILGLLYEKKRPEEVIYVND